MCTYIHFASLSETRIEEHLFTPTNCSSSSSSSISFLLLASSNKAALIPRAIAFSSSLLIHLYEDTTARLASLNTPKKNAKTKNKKKTKSLSNQKERDLNINSRELG